MECPTKTSASQLTLPVVFNEMHAAERSRSWEKDFGAAIQEAFWKTALGKRRATSAVVALESGELQKGNIESSCAAGK